MLPGRSGSFLFFFSFFLRGGEGLVSQTEKEGVVTQAVTLVVVVVGVEG